MRFLDWMTRTAKRSGSVLGKALFWVLLIWFVQWAGIPKFIDATLNYRPGNRFVLSDDSKAATDEQTWERFIVADNAHDTLGVRLLAGTGNLVHLKKGASVLILESDLMTKKVRLLSGERAGLVVWLRFDSLAAAKPLLVYDFRKSGWVQYLRIEDGSSERAREELINDQGELEATLLVHNPLASPEDPSAMMRIRSSELSLAIERGWQKGPYPGREAQLAGPWTKRLGRQLSRLWRRP